MCFLPNKTNLCLNFRIAGSQEVQKRGFYFNLFPNPARHMKESQDGEAALMPHPG